MAARDGRKPTTTAASASKIISQKEISEEEERENIKRGLSLSAGALVEKSPHLRVDSLIDVPFAGKITTYPNAFGVARVSNVDIRLKGKIAIPSGYATSTSTSVDIIGTFEYIRYEKSIEMTTMITDPSMRSGTFKKSVSLSKSIPSSTSSSTDTIKCTTCDRDASDSHSRKCVECGERHCKYCKGIQMVKLERRRWIHRTCLEAKRRTTAEASESRSSNVKNGGSTRTRSARSFTWSSFSSSESRSPEVNAASSSSSSPRKASGGASVSRWISSPHQRLRGQVYASSDPRSETLLVSLAAFLPNSSDSGDPYCAVVLTGFLPKSLRGPLVLRGTSCRTFSDLFPLSDNASVGGLVGGLYNNRHGRDDNDDDGDDGGGSRRDDARAALSAWDVLWTLNLGIDLDVPVAKLLKPMTAEKIDSTKCDRYGFARSGATKYAAKNPGASSTTTTPSKRRGSLKMLSVSARRALFFDTKEDDAYEKGEKDRRKVERARRRRIQLESSRLQKWLAMMQAKKKKRGGGDERRPGQGQDQRHLHPILAHAKLKNRTWKGIPDALRTSLWPVLALGRGAGRERLSRGRTYEEHLADAMEPKNFTDESKVGGVIDRDLRRTFPDALMLKDAKGRQVLRNVLVAYHNYDRTLRYTQGMNFIAALVLSYMPDRDAFWMLVSVMQSYDLRDILMISSGTVFTYCDAFDVLLHKKIPKLGKHFKAKGVRVMDIVMPWFLTVFTSAGFPFEFVLRVWDLFLLEGWPVVFGVALALFYVNRKRLLTYEFEGVLLFLKNKSKPPLRSLIDADELIRVTKSKFIIKEKELKRLLAEANAKRDSGESSF